MPHKSTFPEPEEVSFMLMDRENGAPVPVDCLPQEEWERLRGQILWNVGRSMSEMAARGGQAP